ncbi:hypothetical protein CALVIDRAFT_532349 [Calocera viscosa TUFC12733]|uniref:Uncharacterized protein n=1 Tax=Calocera viscosa (strain TUFC12733) TaxID=1330018 RepID=A0A167S4N1_CALVF|nr:hypothetical protein CALVIDRAFT_532349 [Calocera viscosa TUFC12733]
MSLWEADAKFPGQKGDGLPPKKTPENPGQVYPKSSPFRMHSLSYRRAPPDNGTQPHRKQNTGTAPRLRGQTTRPQSRTSPRSPSP